MPSKSPLQHPAAFASAIARWFEANGRDYPWRRTKDPYAILVSEVMLQQTQITTVLDRGHYDRWMTAFPTFTALANAPEQEVLKAWEGLGYYRRARNLHRLAQTVVSEHGGVFPRDFDASRALPGIGDYTAGAVASFAFDDRHPVVDGNVARVLTRILNDRTPVDSTAGRTRLRERAVTLVGAARSARTHNSALMELGQTVCRPGRPDCKACPVQGFCAATDPASLPVKSKRAKPTAVTERVFFLRNRSGAILLEQETGNRRTGLWKLPALPPTVKPPKTLHRSTYTITRFRVTLHVHAAPSILRVSASPRLPRRFVPPPHPGSPAHAQPVSSRPGDTAGRSESLTDPLPSPLYLRP